MTSTVAFITPNWRWDQSPWPVDTLRPPECPPLEWAYLSTGISRPPHLIDAYVENLSLNDLAARLKDLQAAVAVVATAPSLLYWRCPPFSIGAAAASIAVAKQQRLVTFAVGPHTTYSPSWFVKKTGVDFAFRGSPECELPSLLDAVARNEMKETGNEAWNSTIAVEAAERLPQCDFSIFDWSLPYVPHMWCVDQRERHIAGTFRRAATLEASRGCPWTCVYCAKGPMRDQYGRRPMRIIEAELDALSDRGVDYVFFVDETFNIPGSHLEQILGLLKERGIAYGFQGRPDLIDAEMANLLGESGCVYAELGIDVKTDTLSKDVGRRQNEEAAVKGVAMLSKHVPIVRFNRLNLATVEYRCRLHLSAEQGWDFPPDPAFPYPGAPLGALWAEWNNKAEGEFDWESAEEYAWWLRLEVLMQRSGTCPADEEMQGLQAAFLGSPRQAKEALMRYLEPIATPESFHKKNLILRGHSTK